MSHLRSTTPSRDTSNTSGNENNPLLSSSGGLVSELEQEVLDEYARLLENVNKVHPLYARKYLAKESKILTCFAVL